MKKTATKVAKAKTKADKRVAQQEAACATEQREIAALKTQLKQAKKNRAIETAKATTEIVALHKARNASSVRRTTRLRPHA
jgi:hypothetical protein